MKTLFYCAAVLIWATVAAAQSITSTIQPNDFTDRAKHKPPLQLSNQQRLKIQDALVTAHSAQKTPDKFEAKVGEKLPTMLKLDAMPVPAVNSIQLARGAESDHPLRDVRSLQNNFLDFRRSAAAARGRGGRDSRIAATDHRPATR